MYKCVKCGKLVEQIRDRVICPYCGYRVLIKLRPKVVRRVHAG